jgi:Xaa-Pro aminopeptidase
MLEFNLAKQTTYIEDIRCWGDVKGCEGAAPLPTIASRIKEEGVGHHNIGIELDGFQRIGMSLAEFNELKRLLPDVAFTPSSKPIWKLRAIKSTREIAFMKEASRITDKAVGAVINAIQEGKSEQKLALMAGITMWEEGADWPRSICINSGSGNYDIINGFATERILHRGDMINFTLGVVYQGYCTDVTRSVFLGSPSKKQVEMYETIKKVQEATCRAVRPGRTASQIGLIPEEAIMSLGYRELMLHRPGHGIGLDVAEPPSISRGDDTILEAGMVLVIDPGIYDPSIGSFRIEDNLVVTEGGFEFLSESSREILIK